MASRVRRGAAASLLGALVLGGLVAAPARAAKPFDPKVTVSRSTDAARAATSFSMRITQTEGEEQIGALKLTVPRDPGFTVQTDVAGDDAQVGTIRVVLYTGASPGAPLTINGTIHDHNNRPGCGGLSGRQCVVAKLHVPSQPDVNAELEIWEDPSGYRIESDLTDTWADESVAALQGRLSELSATLNATAGTERVVRNPMAAGTLPFAWDFTSASVPSRGYTGGQKPPCASTSSCTINLASKDYAPSATGLQSPAAGAASFISATPTTFTWGAGWDANDDPLTYTLVVDGNDVASGPGLSASVPLAAGRHTWTVRTDDGYGVTTTSVSRTFTIIDPSAAQVFTSTNGDRLYVVPGAYLYRIGNDDGRGGEAASATADHGYVVATGAFRLAIAYDATTSTAAGYLTLGGQHRPFTDLPG